MLGKILHSLLFFFSLNLLAQDRLNDFKEHAEKQKQIDKQRQQAAPKHKAYNERIEKLKLQALKDYKQEKKNNDKQRVEQSREYLAYLQMRLAELERQEKIRNRYIEKRKKIEKQPDRLTAEKEYNIRPRKPSDLTESNSYINRKKPRLSSQSGAGLSGGFSSGGSSGFGSSDFSGGMSGQGGYVPPPPPPPSGFETEPGYAPPPPVFDDFGNENIPPPVFDDPDF